LGSKLTLSASSLGQRVPRVESEAALKMKPAAGFISILGYNGSMIIVVDVAAIQRELDGIGGGREIGR
jgi:hypothetical protein